MKHLFVPYELALLAKQKGFDEPCLGFYFTENKTFGLFEFCEDEKEGWVANLILNNPEKDYYIATPLFQQLTDWFREKHGLHITLKHKPTSQTYGFTISGKYDEATGGELVNKRYDKCNYYEAINAALIEAFKLI